MEQRGGMPRRLVPGLLAGGLLFGLVGIGVWWSAGSEGRLAAATGEGWQAYPGAFPAPHEWRSGPTAIIADPVGCFVAFGQINTGFNMAPGYWRATADCGTVLAASPSPRPNGDGPPSEDESKLLDAERTPEGDYLAIGRYTFHGDAYAYQGFVTRGDPDRGWRRTVTFSTSTPKASHYGPSGLTRVGDRYVAVGRREGTAVAWTSTYGTTWREIALPIWEGDVSAAALDVVATPDGRVFALGSRVSGGSSQPCGWLSQDAGDSWQPVTLPGTANLTKVVHDGTSFVAVGGANIASGSAAAALTSADGQAWTVDAGIAATGATSVRAVTTLRDGSILAAAGTGQSSGSQPCGVALRRSVGEWRTEELGCSGVPDALAELADGRVVGAAGTTLLTRGTSAGS